jgi:hypothetical protein
VGGYLKKIGDDIDDVLMREFLLFCWRFVEPGKFCDFANGLDDGRNYESR